ncbi:MAG: HDOD domain-containing protein [Desulfobulbaceae bacterium]|uniref:HDOD domain-containing protein n=1 Tax=Candidatus Desulfobia pelagia TaxID=2841692 RepID=A0A8J6TDU2_9BACT|nr:HDOD domain-containing protein [Candidatus Desulfobia pelagia]
MKNPKETARKILNAVKTVPVLSSSAGRILQIIDSSNPSIAALVNIIRNDSPLTANILKAANSAFYGLRSEVSSIDQAVPLIGIDEVVRIALRSGVSDVFEKELTGYKGVAGEFWKHDLRAAIASHKIASYGRIYISPEIAFTGGLLHDIGKAIVSSYLGDVSKKIVEAIDRGVVKDFHEAEKRLLGVDHAMVGFEVARHWNLPEILQNIIRYHHTPSEAPEMFKPIVYCVHLGDILAMMAGYGTGSDTLYYPLDDRYSDFIDLSEDELHLLILEIDEKFEQVNY